MKINTLFLAFFSTSLIISLALGPAWAQSPAQSFEVAPNQAKGLSFTITPPENYEGSDTQAQEYIKVFSLESESGDNFYFAAIGAIETLPVGLAPESLKTADGKWNEGKLKELWDTLTAKIEGKIVLTQSSQGPHPTAKQTSLTSNEGISQYLETQWYVVNDKLIKLECGYNSFETETESPEPMEDCAKFFDSLKIK
ncbi:MAG: hypothetical protein LBV23_10160 [Deltaproteobacteria bacterium]|jgi:hypothetical protein|nr:hypothetical protein [Deltaproteobacteria bacterium]